MAQHTNRRVILKERATGLPKPELFEVVEDDAPSPGDGEILINNIYVSADPGMKGWISVARNYASVETGTTMHAFSVGVAVESNHPDVQEGDVVAANTGWAEYAVADPTLPTFRKVDPEDAPISTALGILGINGFTAYCGLLNIGQPQAGDTVVVSTAAGAVGSAVGQIAKIKGCRTVGIAGGAEKSALCTDVFGYDAVIDYKATDDLESALREVCPDGINVYYDNVGGETLDIVLGQVALHGRVVICGTAATDAWIPQPSGLRPERNLLVNRIRMEGFLTFDFVDQYAEAHAQLSTWVREGKIAYREDVAEGLENAPAALAGLYEGRNMGRQLVRVRPDPFA
ncbi:MAG: NADP-dependent oxidoreductase [Alphaproteobacteria bacterium]|nr:NADP-dependent oxidoreductase [Alphaproteobacteria bacterium]